MPAGLSVSPRKMAASTMVTTGDTVPMAALACAEMRCSAALRKKEGSTVAPMARKTREAEDALADHQVGRRMADEEGDEGADRRAAHGDAGEQPRPHDGDDRLGEQLVEGEGERRGEHQPGADDGVGAAAFHLLDEDQRQAGIADQDRAERRSRIGWRKNSAPKITTNSG